ncbi:FIST signal transduction protein [Mucilaginibacter kameinonensis]|uniref:FIST signal transduction protein n=1 Tax=Mucilaginibacter kameinonensis TaxID=452286 RepID=UPI000EF7E792|nr:FIST N-terminal domain-containing protein [Mucilaginibacter kameinonensis]
MKIRQHHFVNKGWVNYFADPEFSAEKCQLVLAFGAPQLITDPGIYDYLKSGYPNANIVFASTSGEIIGSAVFDDSIVVTAVELEKSTISCTATHVNEQTNSSETGAFLMSQLDKKGLNCVFIISDGTFINGSELVDGFNRDNPGKVPVTGGLAGDAARFSSTFTSLNAIPARGNVIAIGFYGDNLHINHGSCGGWEEFGPQRTITRSDKNVLFEIDGKSALDLYKEYLGEYAKELPGSALLFPLSLSIEGSDKKLVRTILNVNEDEKSMTFAGNLPEDSKVRLMKANFEKLIDASSSAATDSIIGPEEADLAILVSCVGRKLVLNDRTDEELIAAKNIFGDKTSMAGFYSYGELSPLNKGSNCELHNQTMTITTFTER